MLAPSADLAIELKRLSRHYGKTRAVDDVSFIVPRGSVFGYIGPNGAGKTTSMRILATLETPTLGDAFVDGFSSINDPDRVRARLGFMPDGFGAYRNTNCIEYLDFFARANGLIGRYRQQRIDWVLDFTGVRPIAEKPVRGLSKGMRQRLSLGRALVHDPTVLILDEPANGLDPRARIELRRMVGALAADGKTVLISSHILTELAEMCDRVGIIERGQILAEGTVDAMRAQLSPRRNLQMQVASDPAQAASRLEQIEGVEEVRVEGSTVLATVVDSDAQQASILRKMVASEVDVISFSAQRQSLEDVFLHITQGKVQ
jgi:ABC-2 type transport system ATP-binding protein